MNNRFYSTKGKETTPWCVQMSRAKFSIGKPNWIVCDIR